MKDTDKKVGFLTGYEDRQELGKKLQDYETIIGMFSKALDELVHACEHSYAYTEYPRIESACAKAKELLPFYQSKED